MIGEDVLVTSTATFKGDPDAEAVNVEALLESLNLLRDQQYDAYSKTVAIIDTLKQTYVDKNGWLTDAGKHYLKTRMMLGKNNVECAKAVGITIKSVRSWRRRWFPKSQVED